jgi:hypothetical protein
MLGPAGQARENEHAAVRRTSYRLRAHRAGEVQVRGEHKLQGTAVSQGEGPVVVLNEVDREPVAVVADQGLGAPLSHEPRVGPVDDLAESDETPGNVGIVVMADDPPDVVERNESGHAF